MAATPLSRALRIALADTWAFYFMSHSFHWNVRGPLFESLHEFFGDLYEDAHDAVDGMAERLRTLREDAPVSLDDIRKGSTISFGASVPAAGVMIKKLMDANEAVIKSLKAADEQADKAGNSGLCNFIQDRLDKHAKHGWMLQAFVEEGTKGF